ncbi:MAG: vanadium nitrogenase [Roseburia sp.]
MAFLASFLQYFIIFVILVALAAGACFLGIFLRKRKDAKLSAADAKDQK